MGQSAPKRGHLVLQIFCGEVVTYSRDSECFGVIAIAYQTVVLSNPKSKASQFKVLRQVVLVRFAFKKPINCRFCLLNKLTLNVFVMLSFLLAHAEP